MRDDLPLPTSPVMPIRSPAAIRQEIPSGLMLRIDTAIPFGLLLNELLTNAIKYAASDGNTEITVAIAGDEGRITLTVRDNGKGIPEGVDTTGGSSIGMNLIVNLSKQLGGNPEFRNDSGTVFSLTFNAG